MAEGKNFEVIIIGGSYAGLSAAMALGRSLRNVLVIDGGEPCNRQTPYSHNFLTHDGSTPKEITALAKSQVANYKTIHFYDGIATTGKKIDFGFEIFTSKNESFSAKKIVFATGIKDILPEINGFAECWAISLVHCPYCHGFEIRDKKTAIIANGERAFHIASLVNNLTKNLTLVTSNKHDFNEDQLEKLKKHQIDIIEKEILEIRHKNGKVEKIVFTDGSSDNFDCAYAALPFEQKTSIPRDLGCEITEMGLIKVDMFQKTTIEGIYACGDNSHPMRSLATAVYTGNLVGAMVNSDLVKENFS